MIQIEPLGDLGILMTFGEEIRESTQKKIQQFTKRLIDEKIAGIIEWVPAYTTLAIYYQPEKIGYHTLVEKLQTIYSETDREEVSSGIVYEIPVLYGGETGPDLSYIAQYHRISEEDVIKLHSEKEYLIYMMGFVPGFPYLGGLSPKLAVPRLEHPRACVQAGSVGIGGNQTGIYPAVVPSGWRILGITPIKLFDLKKNPPVLFTAGDSIKFYPVHFEEFQHIRANKNYKIKTYLRGEKRENH